MRLADAKGKKGMKGWSRKRKEKKTPPQRRKTKVRVSENQRPNGLRPAHYILPVCAPKARNSGAGLLGGVGCYGGIYMVVARGKRLARMGEEWVPCHFPLPPRPPQKHSIARVAAAGASAGPAACGSTGAFVCLFVCLLAYFVSFSRVGERGGVVGWVVFVRFPRFIRL